MTQKELLETLAGIDESVTRARRRLMEEEVKRKSRQTCWNGVGTRRSSQPCMFGEGLGNSLNFCSPKYEAGVAFGQGEEEPDPEEVLRRRREGVEKAKVTRARNKRRKAKLKEAIQKGEELEGQRVFLVDPEWTCEDFDRRAKRYGGVPDRVDVHHTEFGNILLVPVIEEREGREMELLGGQRDVTGRWFWVAPSMKKAVEKIFGRVQWSRPLTLAEAKAQFGARIR